MTYQERRSLAFLAANILTTAAYAAVVAAAFGTALAASPDDRALWATVVLVFIPAQVIVRLAVHIALAVHASAAEGCRAVDLEDEMDKAIDRRSTIIAYHFILAGLIGGLLSQTLGLGVPALFLAIAAGFVAGGIGGDTASLAAYRRGV